MKGSQMIKKSPWVNDCEYVALQIEFTEVEVYNTSYKRNMTSSSPVNNRSCSGVKVPSHPFQRQRGRFGLSTSPGHLVTETTLFLLVLDDDWMMHHGQVWGNTSMQTCKNILREREKKLKMSLYVQDAYMGDTSSSFNLSFFPLFLSFLLYQKNDKSPKNS